MTRQKLIVLLEQIQEQVESLENDVEYWEKEYDELEEKFNLLQDEYDKTGEWNGIKDIDKFIWKLKLEDNLYSRKLEEFITYYMNYYNED